jgi:putative methyltransferase (TIGR04325 family)
VISTPPQSAPTQKRGNVANKVKQFVIAVPGVQRFRRWRHERYFAGPGYAAYRGVFSSFDEARASAPASKPLGFDNEGFVQKYSDRSSRVFPYDYPMLYWLQRLFADTRVIFDWGGHLGVHYYGYSKYLTYPAGFQWIVCEVPRIVAAGTEQARAGRDTIVRFTTNPRDADGADILMAAGSLQYIETPTLPGLLMSLTRRPSHLLLNKLPLYPGDDFVTLQNGGASFVPLRVWNRESFIGSLSSLGYELVDEWLVPERPLLLPTFPERSFSEFTGVYLRKRE